MAASYSQEIFRYALDHDPDAVLITDAAGAIRFASGPEATVLRLIERLERKTARRRPIPAGAPFTGSTPAVLIVLRDSGMREAAAGLLKISGYPVLTSRTAQEAERLARLHPRVGFVLTEQVLGASATGAELIGTLRSMLGASLRAILLSDDPSIARANRFGPADSVRVACIPVPADELLRMLDDLRQEETPELGRDSR